MPAEEKEGLKSPLPDPSDMRDRGNVRLRGLTPPRVIVAILLAASASEMTASVAQEREGPVAVRYVEGTVHGFLRLRNTAGKSIAAGELLQVPRRRGLDSRMVW